MGRVSEENYENIRNLLERISKSYETVLFITHNAEIKDWFNNTVVVRKENNISKLSLG
jgi:DNA repair exonuclease SbcCD ATPase subunit